ncbi:MAG: hypothetical protein ABWZ40_11260 [Caulobacterales bacterium]
MLKPSIPQVILAPNDNPPADVDHALIMLTKSGGVDLFGVWPDKTGGGGRFIRESFPDLQRALDAAQALGPRGIKTIYIRRLADA